ncbi:MAG: hypothetical protein KatS3mg027_1287 [Bacteroidia bacterium]|nr:MAG: hypothetical protein KatS3mg027_1287 [Bacteroidia bacterium]
MAENSFSPLKRPVFTKQSEAINLPVSYAVKPLRQTISYEKNILVITNYFDELNNENAYLDIVEYIEKKAQLDVNEQQFQQNNASKNPIAEQKNITENKEEKSELSASNTPIPPNNTQELLQIVKKDAQEAQQEVNQLEIENNQLNQVLQIKNNEISEIEKNIQETQNQINASDSKEEKEQLTQLLNELKNKKKYNIRTKAIL